MDDLVIHPPSFDFGPRYVIGDMIDAVTGDVIVGPYCEWPKRMVTRRVFSVFVGGGHELGARQ